MNRRMRRELALLRSEFRVALLGRGVVEVHDGDLLVRLTCAAHRHPFVCPRIEVAVHNRDALRRARLPLPPELVDLVGEHLRSDLEEAEAFFLRRYPGDDGARRALHLKRLTGGDRWSPAVHLVDLVRRVREARAGRLLGVPLWAADLWRRTCG